jgi:hypothetical protein
MTKNYKVPKLILLLISIVLINLNYSCKRERAESKDIYTVHSYPLPVNVSSENFVKKLRKQENLSPVKKRNKNKAIEKLPGNTYFFMSVDSMSGKNFSKVLKCKPDTKKSGINFELHKHDGKIYLLVFVTYEIATNISELDGEEVKSLTVFSHKSQEFNHLAMVPVSRIISAQKRKIFLSKDHFIHVMDITVK